MLKEQLQEVKISLLANRRKTSIKNIRRMLNIPVTDHPELTLESYVDNNYEECSKKLEDIISKLDNGRSKGLSPLLSIEDYDIVHKFVLLYKAKKFFENKELKSVIEVQLPQDWVNSALFITYQIQKQMSIRNTQTKRLQKQIKTYKGKLRSK